MLEDSAMIQIVYCVILGIAAQWLSWRLRFPAIIVLSLVGIIVGPILGWIQPQESFGQELPSFVEIAVAIILFEGALNLRIYELKEAASGVKRLVSIGVLLNFGLGALFAYYVGNFSWPIAFFMGAILIVTGPTVIMPALRQSKINRRPASFLKWEGIINDPLGALLAIICFEYIVYSGDGSPFLMSLFGIGKAIAVAIISGGLVSYALYTAFKKNLVPDFLKVPLVLSSVLALLIISNFIQEGSGLLSATFLGVILGNIRFSVIEDLKRFKESLSLFVLSTVFIVLASSIELRSLTHLDPSHILFLICVVFVIRPLAVFLSTIRSEMDWRERLIVAWFGPRGIVSASVVGTFAPRLVDLGFQEASSLLPLTFLIIFMTVTIHGGTLSMLSKALGLSARKRNGILIIGAYPWNIQMAKALLDANIPVTISDSSPQRLRKAKAQKIPVHEGLILADLEDGKPDLNLFRAALIATENDAYNTLVSTKLGIEMGRKNIFQVAPAQSDRSAPAEFGGQILSHREFDFENMMKNYFQGWTFEIEELDEAKIKEVFDREERDETRIPVALLTKEGQARFIVPETIARPEPGTQLLSYVHH